MRTSRPLTGTSREALWHEENRRVLESYRIADSDDIVARQSTKGTTLHLRSKKGGGGDGESVEVARFSIVEVFTDYLSAYKYAEDGVSLGGELVYIAKPYALRVTPFDGQTRNGRSYAYAAADTGGQTRTVKITALSSTGTVLEKVQLDYAAGDSIYAVEPFGTTGIVGGAVEVTWLDINVDGRHWEIEPRLVCARVSGQELQTIVQAGPPF